MKVPGTRNFEAQLWCQRMNFPLISKMRYAIRCVGRKKAFTVNCSSYGCQTSSECFLTISGVHVWDFWSGENSYISNVFSVYRAQTSTGHTNISRPNLRKHVEVCKDSRKNILNVMICAGGSSSLSNQMIFVDLPVMIIRVPGESTADE